MKKNLLVLLIFILGCAGSRQTIENPPKKGDSNIIPYGKKYEYIYKIVKPVIREKLYFSDQNIKVEFVIDDAFIHLRLKNKRSEKIWFNLGESQIFIGMRSSKVINFNYENEFNYSPVSLKSEQVDIFPNAFVVLHLAPADNVFTSSGDYEVSWLYPVVDFNDNAKVKEIYGNIGKRIGLYLPIETEKEIYDYYFEFEITGVREVGVYQPRKKQVPVQAQLPSEIVIKGEGLNPSESFIASTLISFFVLISAYFIFAREKGKI
jgi:hypothetical protein